MNDIQLDTTTYDLLIENSDILLFDDIENLTRQTLNINLQNYRGEWFRDINVGVPYLQSILGVRNSQGVADVLIKTAILETDNIDSIIAYESIVNSERQLKVIFSALMTSGGEISNFILEI